MASTQSANLRNYPVGKSPPEVTFSKAENNSKHPTHLNYSMKLKSLLTLALTLAIGGSMAFAEEDTPLMKEMKTINKNLRTLKRQVEDVSKKDENLALIDASKKAVEASMKLDPMKTKDVPAGEKAAYLEKYKAQMTDLAKSYGDLETAVKAGKADDAKKVFEKLSELKEKGHKDFAPEE
jgi:cytochrome c556